MVTRPEEFANLPYHIDLVSFRAEDGFSLDGVGAEVPRRDEDPPEGARLHADSEHMYLSHEDEVAAAVISFLKKHAA